MVSSGTRPSLSVTSKVDGCVNVVAGRSELWGVTVLAASAEVLLWTLTVVSPRAVRSREPALYKLLHLAQDLSNAAVL